MDKDRKIAFEILYDILKNGAFSNLAIKDHLEKQETQNSGFIRELVYGVIENLIYIDHAIDQLAAKGIKSIKIKELILIRMGIYQIKYLDSVPEYAAINETVNIAKKIVRGREKFINGILRAFARNIKEKDFLPSKDNLTFYLSCKYSYSPWIIDLWKKEFKEEELESLLNAGNMKPALCLRNNVQKATREELINLLSKEGIESENSKISNRGIIVKGKNIIGNHLYEEGYYSVQDETSIVTADFIMPKEGDKIIDMCAAPGGKTLAMAEALGEEGHITAMDIYPHKLTLIENQAKRLGLTNITTKAQDSTKLIEEYINGFDKVLCDVPCSGLGVIRHKPEIKLKAMEELDTLYEIQSTILNNAAKYLKKGGTLVYSTCTINKKENQEQIEKFLRINDKFEKVFEKQYLPHIDGTDGFYIAKLILK